MLRKTAETNLKEADREIQKAAKDLRINLEMSVADFAQALGISVQMIYMLERGDRDWSDDLITKIETL
jgi:transcriptional regulator with XRE-family HTH domain